MAFKRRGTLCSLKVTGLKRTILYTDHIVKNLPKLSDKLGLLLLRETRQQYIQNLRAKAKYDPVHGVLPSGRSTHHAAGHPGKTANSFHIDRLADGKWLLYSMNPVAEYIEEGTAPHFIKRGLGLATGVDHPGSRGYHCFRDAVHQTAESFRSWTDSEMKNLFAGMGSKK